MNDDWTAQIDQMMAGFRDIARLSAAFMRELTDEGFSREEALVQVVAWQREHLWGGSSES